MAITAIAGGFIKKLLVKKAASKLKKSGKQMAENITNKPKPEVDKSQNPTTVFHESGADLKPLEDIRDDMKGSSKKSKDPLNLALDGIDNALFGIINTLTETNILKKKMKSDAAKAQLIKKKSLRESFLKAGSGVVKGVVGATTGILSDTWDKLMQFLTWTILGAVVNYIMKNWETVKEQIKKVMDALKETFARLKPILVVIKDIVIWLGTTAWDWIVRIKDVKEGTTPQKVKEIERILKDPEMLEKAWKGNAQQLEKLFNELEKAETREEKAEVMRKYAPLFDTQRGKVPKLWRRMPGPGFQGALGAFDPHVWRSLIRPQDVLYYKANPKDPRFMGELIGDENDLLIWFHTDEGKRYLKDHDPEMLKLVEEGYYKNHEETKHLFETEKYLELNDNKERDSEFNNSSSIFNLSNKDSAFNTSSFWDKEIESRTYDLKNISTYDYAFNEDFSKSINIFITGEEGSSSINQGSSPLFLSLGEGNSFTINEAQLLNLYKD